MGGDAKCRSRVLTMCPVQGPKRDDVLGIAAAPLVHIPLETRVAALPAPDPSPWTDSSVNCVDGPYFGLFSPTTGLHDGPCLANFRPS